MTALRACAWQVIVIAVGISSFAVPGAGSIPEVDPWEASDRFDPWPSPPSASGWRGEVGMVTREAVSEEWESLLRAGFEPVTGPGGFIAWRRYWVPRGPSANDVEAALVLRMRRVRLTAGGGALRYGSRQLLRGTTTVHVGVLEAVLVGARVAFYPDDRFWETTILLRAAYGPWLGGLERGPSAGLHRLSVGLRLSPRLVWTATYAGSSPGVGIAWRGLGGEFRAETTRHPLLGSVTRVRWVAGGLAP